MVTVRKSLSVCSFVLVNVAEVESPWVPLMVEDIPSLLEHLKSNQLGKRSFTIRSRVTILTNLYYCQTLVPSSWSTLITLGW
jgi:hypothetical protein